MAASGAIAAPVTTYSSNVTPTAIYGTSGGMNGGFTVTRDASTGLELGLRARVRFTNDFMDQGNGTYGSFAPNSGPLALWNFDFAVNSNYNGAGTTLGRSGLNYIIGVDFDPAVGNVITTTYNLTTGCFDNQFGTNSTGVNGGTAANCSVAANAANSYSTLYANNNAMQNSENLGFFGQNFDASAPGQYSFFLRAVNNLGVTVAESDITVNVPEPAPIALLGLGLAGLVVTSRRRKTRV